ncbi:MAG: 1-phosphofructokinase family hexose kinase [Acidithiobacillus sp.]
MIQSPPHCQDIAALTLNPSVDISYEVDQLVPDQKTSATATRYDPGGNGINVARVLKKLLVCAHSCCVVAGNVGELLQQLLLHQLDSPHCTPVMGETRINVTILQQQPSQQLEITAAGPRISAIALESITQTFLDLSHGGYGIVTGSVPPGVPEDIYGALTDKIQSAGGKAIVDAHGALLAKAISHRPFLIKPNRYELSLLCGKDLPTLESVVFEAQNLRRQGVQYICVSLGADGALLVGPEGSYIARAPAVTVRSTVGAGDSMVAGLVAGFAQGKHPSEALRLGVACGSATAMQPGTALATRNDVITLLQEVDVQVFAPDSTNKENLSYE